MVTVHDSGSPLRRPHGRDGAPNPYRTEPLTTPDDEIRLPWDYTLVAGAEAMPAVRSLRKQRPAESAVLLGTVHDVGFLLEALDGRRERRSIEDTLRAADAIDIAAWLAEYRDRDEEDEVWLRELPVREQMEERFHLWLGQRIDAKSRQEYGVAAVNDSQFARVEEPLVIGLLPTADPTEVPAHLRFGDFNSCHEPEYHVAVARHWQQHHGAELVTCTNDTIEFRVGRPVRGPWAARRMARHHDRYAGVAQVGGSIGDVAAAIRTARYWHFWWD